MRLSKICEFCNSDFIAKTTVTKYCSDNCAKRAYKKRKRDEKIKIAVNNEFYKSQKIDVDNLSKREFLSVNEVCILLGISRMSFYRYSKKGIIESTKIGRRVLVARRNIDKLFQ